MQRRVGVASLEDLCEGSANGYATVMLDMHRLFVRFGSIDAGFSMKFMYYVSENYAFI